MNPNSFQNNYNSRDSALTLSLVMMLSLTMTCCQSNDGTLVETRLPVIKDSSSCPEEKAEPDVCDWVHSMDAIVIGRVTDVRLMSYPAEAYSLVGDPPEAVWTLVDSCDGGTMPSMVLDLEIQRVFFGDIQSRVSVYIGQTHIAVFDPLPIWGPDDTLMWAPKGSNDGGGIEPGMNIGFAIHFDERDEVWSLMGENMFKFTSPDGLSGQINLQQVNGECWEPPPSEIEGMTLEDFGAFIESSSGLCTSTANERKERVKASWGTRRHHYWTAYCGPILDGSGGECTLDSDCKSGELCKDGVCT